MALNSIMSVGCNKILEEKSDKRLVVPSALADFQSILDNYSKNVFSKPGSGEVSSTDYYLSDDNYRSLSRDTHKRMYIWEKDHLFEPTSNEWSNGYASVYAANSVLSGIDDLEVTGPAINWRNDIKGQAMFLRANSHINMAYIWTLAYDEETADIDMGLPLRLTTDFNERSERSTLRETYAQVVSDLREAARLLPDRQEHLVRPSRPAAYALLARVYLSMREYELAGRYADSCLQIYDTLLDYSSLDVSATYPFKQFNEETLVYGVIGTPAPINPSRAKIDPELYALYGPTDIRKPAFFKTNKDGSHAFKGNYTGTLAPFGGLSTNEVYLILAESLAREGKVEEALTYLNTLLENRHTDDFVPLSASSSSAALELILLERRKELLMRGLRWMDIKRLNREGAGIIQKRTVEGIDYVLLPNDPRYALPIPEDVISLSGMEQNKR